MATTRINLTTTPQKLTDLAAAGAPALTIEAGVDYLIHNNGPGWLFMGAQAVGATEAQVRQRGIIEVLPQGEEILEQATAEEIWLWSPNADTVVSIDLAVTR